MADYKYEIVKKLRVLSESVKGWMKELKRIAWNDGETKLDIRD